MSDHRESALCDATRRTFLQFASGATGATWLALQLPGLFTAAQAAAQARRSGAAFLCLSPTEAAGLDAIVARIIPSDESPGAREAGAIHFIDQALEGFMADSADALRTGLASLDERAAGVAGGGRFADLGPGDQDALLRDIEASPFFGLMHFLTVAGTFALPEYGGNHDHVGWKLLGFAHRHGWTPPFGHYDAEPTGAPAPGADTDGSHGHG